MVIELLRQRAGGVLLPLAGVVVGVALLAGPVRAQEQGEIVWITRPTTAQPPAGRVYGIAMSVRCTVRGGALTDCTAHPAEAPEGYAESAIVAAAHARVAAEDSGGVAVEGRVIEVPIGFPIPVAINPPPAPPGNVEGRLSGVVWLEQPDASDYVRLYPRRAWDENVSGRATVECIVGDTGRLTCELIAEDPLGYGFGEATIRASLLFRVAPQTRTGEPTAGGRVARTIRWRTESLRGE